VRVCVCVQLPVRLCVCERLCERDCVCVCLCVCVCVCMRASVNLPLTMSLRLSSFFSSPRPSTRVSRFTERFRRLRFASASSPSILRGIGRVKGGREGEWGGELVSCLASVKADFEGKEAGLTL
jgi:hypothetical protein